VKQDDNPQIPQKETVQAGDAFEITVFLTRVLKYVINSKLRCGAQALNLFVKKIPPMAS
jgi:hypothetical protein